MLSVAMSCKVVQHTRLTLVQEELPALPDFASSAWGEECLSPFVYKRGRQFQVNVEKMNDRQLKTCTEGFMVDVEKDANSKDFRGIFK